MKIKVRYFTTLRELAENKEEFFEMENGANLAKLIEMISLKYVEAAFIYLHDKITGKIDPSIKFLINGEDVYRLRGFKTILKEGDIVAVIPPIGGG